MTSGQGISLIAEKIQPNLFAEPNKITTFAKLKEIGAVLEWLKRHAWKACIRQKRIPSSNLGRSAKKALVINPIISAFHSKKQSHIATLTDILKAVGV